VAHNELLMRKPELMNSDAYDDGWMLIVRPAHEDWRAELVTGAEIASAFERWLASDAYKDRAG
jgi:glycine cleavage system H protein